MNLEEGSDAIIAGHTIAAVGDRVDVAWVVSSATWIEVFFAQSMDGGRTFGDHINVSNNPDLAANSLKIISKVNEVYLVWEEWDANNIQHISFARSDDGGKSFHTITNINQNTEQFAFEPQIAVDKSTVYLAWREDLPPDSDGPPLNIVFTKSTDFGKTFETKRFIADGGWPEMAVVGDNIYISFGIQDRGVENVGFVRSLDGGATFSNQTVLSSNTWSLHPRDSNRIFPQISADGSNVFIVWTYTESAESGSKHVPFVVASYDNGETFTTPVKISSSTGETDAVHVQAIGDDTSYIAWQESNDRIFNLSLVKGMIPKEYADLYPVPPNENTTNSALDALTIIVPVTAVAVAGGIIYYVKAKKGKRE